MAVDDVWQAFMRACKALVEAKNQKERGSAIEGVQAFLSDDLHRAYVHKWRGWGLLFSNLLHIVKVDVQGYLGIVSAVQGSTPTKKRKVKAAGNSGKNATSTFLRYWHYLRNEFAAAHAVDGPMLHLDANGRECVTQVMQFCLAVINRDTERELDPYLSTSIETEAWQTIELIVQFRVYCADLTKDEMRDVLELTLAAIDRDSAPLSADQLVTRASVCHLAIKNCPYDIHDWLPRLSSFFGKWFTDLDPEEDSSLAVIAPKLVEVLTELCKLYFPTIGRFFLPKHGLQVLRYIQRQWRETPYRQRNHLADFIVIVLDLYEFNFETLSRTTEMSPRKMFRLLSVLKRVVLNTKELQQVSSQLRPTRSSLSGSSGLSGQSLDSQTIAFLTCTADVVYAHDILLTRIEEARFVEGTENDEEKSTSESPVQARRNVMAWETLLKSMTGTEENSASIASSQSLSLADVQRKRRSAIPWMLIILSLMRRHGQFYVQKRIGDVITLMQELIHHLEVKEADQRHFVTLQMLVQLAIISRSEGDLRGDLFEEHWSTVWQLMLRPDLPFFKATKSPVCRGELGELVFVILTCCIAFQLVSPAEIERKAPQLWDLFHHGLSRSQVSSVSSPSSPPLCQSVITFITCLLQFTNPPYLPHGDEEAMIVEPNTEEETSQVQDLSDGSPRGNVLQALFNHIQLNLRHNEAREQGDATQDRITEMMPVLYASALSSLIEPSARLVTVLNHDRLPTLLAQLSGTRKSSPSELESFGVHFTLQERGLSWMSEEFERGEPSTSRSKSFPTLVAEIRSQVPIKLFRAQSAGAMEGCEGLQHVALPVHLMRSLATDDFDDDAMSSRIIMTPPCEGSDAGAIAKDVVSATMSDINASFAVVFDGLANRLSSAKVNSHRYYLLLDSAMMVGLTLATLYAEFKDDQRKTMQLGAVALLERFLSIFAGHFRRSVIDLTRHMSHCSPVFASQLLIKFHTLVLILQGKSVLSQMRHPFSQVDLRIPSELRPSIRKIVAEVEASLELVASDSNSAPGSRLKQREPALSLSHPSSTGSDWDSVASSQASIRSSMSRSLSSSDALDEGAQQRSVQVPKTRNDQRVLSLWSLRVILMLKKESGLKVVSNHVLELDFPPDFLLAVASTLCGIPGIDSLQMLVKLIEEAATEISRGNRERVGNSASGLLFASDVVFVLHHCATMHEGRKRSQREEVPELLLRCARASVDRVTSDPYKASLRVARRIEVQALEAFFRLDPDLFGDFIEVIMLALDDVDTTVRITSTQSMPSIFYMFPDGRAQAFRDLFQIMLPADERKQHLETASGDDKFQADNHSEWMEYCMPVLSALYVCACSDPLVVPEVLAHFTSLANGTFSTLFTRPTILHPWLSEIARWYSYPSVSRLLDDHFCFLWSKYIATQAGGLSDSEEERKHLIASGSLRATTLLDGFPGSILLQEGQHAVASLFRRNMDAILPLAVLYDAVAGGSSGQFPLVDDLKPVFFSSNDPDVPGISLATEEQLITDLFALAFVLQSTANTTYHDAANCILMVAEDKASTYALSISHLGHVVLKMARFSIWDIVCDQESNDPDIWQRAMKSMKDKYSGYDWSQMNLAELLSGYHEIILRCSSSGPMSARAVECFCLFIDEIHNAVRDSFVLQQLMLHVSFQAIRVTTSRLSTKSSTRKLTRLVRKTCEAFMRSEDRFGKYVNSVVQEIAGFLVAAEDVSASAVRSSSSASRNFWLEADDQADLEWVIFAICNNLAGGLGKHIADIDMVDTRGSSCLEKLNSLITTGRRKEDCRDATDSAALLSSKYRQARQEINQFAQRSDRIDEKFYRSSMVLTRSTTHSQPSAVNLTTESTQFLLLQENIRNLHGKLIVSNDDPSTQEAIGRLIRYLFDMSTRSIHDVSSNQSLFSDSVADLLGEVGAWDPQVVELSLGHNVEELSRLYGRRFRRGALFETKVTFRSQMYESLLFYLASLLFDSGVSNSDVIYEAVRTLKNVLSLEKGINSLSKCKDTELKQFIEPFVNESPSNWSLSPLAISQAPTGSISSKSQLRRVLSLSEVTSYDQWICTVTSALTSYCDDEVLRSCSKLVTHRADLAAFLFPFAIQCIFRSEKADRELTTIVTKCVREILSGMQAGQEESNSQQVTVDEPAVQLLIHTLNFLRETEKSFFVESNGRTAAATPVKKSPESGQKNSSAPLNRVSYSCIIDVDLLEVAAAAIRVKMPYSAMQYVEMWLESQLGGVISSLALLSSSLTTLNHVLKAEEKVRSLLVEAYSFDNDVDGLYGVNDGRRVVSQLVTHNQERSYNKTLPLYDVSLQFQHSDLNHQQLVEGMFNALNRLGYHHMLGGYLQAMGAQQLQTPQLDEYQYELAWKGLQWEHVGNQLHTSSVASFKVNHATKVYKHNRAMYQSLKALAYGDYQHVLKLTAMSKASILASVRLSLLGQECTTDSLTALLQLQSVHQVEAAARLIDQHTKTISSGMINAASDGNHTLASLSALFESWSEKRKQVSNQFDMAETLISLEEVLAEVTNVPNRHRILAKLYLSSSTLSRKADRIAVAYKAQMKLQKLSDQRLLTLHDEIEWKLEKAKLLWQQHETRSAIWTAKQVSNEIAKYCEEAARSGDVQLRMLHVAALTVTGRWMASQRSENSQVILGDYLQKATEIVDSMKSEEVAGSLQHATKAHFALAHYMAEMYNQVHSRVTSREWIAGKRVAEARQNELMMLVQMDEQQQMASRAHIHALNKEVGYDAEERARVEASVDEFLSGALRSYGKGLALSPGSELAVVFRVLSLWFANQLKPVVNGVLQEIIDIVPSYKFVPLSYQLMSRIGSTSTTSSTDASNLFELVLSRMVLKLCEEHPHHALVQLIALKNSGDVEGKGALEFRTNVGDAKSESARKYLDKLRKGQQRELLESLDVLSNAYVQLALFDTRDFHKQTKKIPLSKAPIVALSGHSVSFDHCLRDRSRRGANRAVMPPVLTASIAPRSDMDYSSVVRVSSFDTNFSITDSGIHRPKIIYCYGSDGQRFKQLVKGKDDTRQDLVIEQVFETVNHFLKEDDETLKRKLRLCTYKVVPLSPIAGVLEWVDKTMPWGAYLVGRSGKRLSAHERYHPHEWKHADCRMYLKNAPNKFDAYQQIEAHFTPVFHHFFLEKYPDPAMWYQRRLAYVQSAAVTSIVGYILGIGDRHSQNILIHEETAELVHIDFGVVFDQGMALFTPETVPFRLTRDLVDGMGVSGVDGVFTRCCEATLQLLRKKSASVVTILEVVMHDPLYRWTLSPLKALRIQKEGHDGAESRKHSRTDDLSDDSTSTERNMTTGSNDAAMRALIRVKQKLEGYEDPNGNALSIEGQVKQLISVAQDQHNLCALFPGWAPWL